VNVARGREGERERLSILLNNTNIPMKVCHANQVTNFIHGINLCFSMLVDTVEIDVTLLIVVLELSVGW